MTVRWTLVRVLCGIGLATVAASGVAAAAAEGDGRIAYLAQSEGYWQAWVMEADGSGQRAVTSSAVEKTRVSWYPDGAHLLVTALDGRLFKVAIESGQSSAVPSRLREVSDAAVSPDGTQIAVSYAAGGAVDGHGIWLMGIEGTDPRRLVNLSWLQHQPAWSPDGRWVYFSSGDGGQSHDLWRVSVDGATRAQLTAGQLYHFEVAIGPQGEVAFSSNRSGDYEIYAWAAVGSDMPPRRLTESPGLDGHPTWSPDGRSIAFHSTRAGVINVWRMDLASGVVTQLTHHAAGARVPVWWGPR